jgi:hypothetical protein
LAGLVPLARARPHNRVPLVNPANVVLLALEEPTSFQLASTVGSVRQRAFS